MELSPTESRLRHAETRRQGQVDKSTPRDLLVHVLGARLRKSRTVDIREHRAPSSRPNLDVTVSTAAVPC